MVTEGNTITRSDINMDHDLITNSILQKRMKYVYIFYFYIFLSHLYGCLVRWGMDRDLEVDYMLT